jgi:ribose transport system ATP-binding protein
MTVMEADIPRSPVLETRGLSMTYPGTRALDGVTLAFGAGRVSALVGRNGAGKSTLLKILSGALRPSAGEVRIDGARVDLRSPAEARAHGIATVHQELSLIPGLSAAENVLLGRFPRRRGLARAAIDWRRLDEEAAEILAGMDVRVDPRAIVARLPLAQRQMIEIARAVSSGARAVLFDEPTAGLARAETLTLFRLVRGLAERGVAVVYVTHHLGEIAEIADTVTAVRDGKVAATIPAREISAAALVAMMYGEDAPDARAQAFGSAAAGETTPAAARGDRTLPVLEVEGLALAGVLHDVSFMLMPGEILGIAGMLGSGRTELLMALFGARPAERGRILVRGASDGASGPVARSAPLSEVRLDATSCRPARMRALGLALVPEDRKTQGLVMGMSVLDNLCLASLSRTARRGVITRSRQRTAALPAVKDLDLVAPDLAAPVGVLSGGNQQKVVLGKWLLRDPRVLLCDEPARGVDVRAKGQLFEALREMSRRGIASILVSSELEELLEVSHRILVLRRGTLSGEHRPGDLTLDRLVALTLESGGTARSA